VNEVWKSKEVVIRLAELMVSLVRPLPSHDKNVGPHAAQRQVCDCTCYMGTTMHGVISPKSLLHGHNLLCGVPNRLAYMAKLQNISTCLCSVYRLFSEQLLRM